MAERASRLLRAGHVILALFGTLPGSLLACVALTRFAPLSLDDAFAIGFLIVIPLWVTAMYFAFLAKSAGRLLAACVLVTAVFGALLSFA